MDEPLAKKRRICKWNPEWSRYNLRESSKDLVLLIATFVLLIYQLLEEEYAK